MRLYKWLPVSVLALGCVDPHSADGDGSAVAQRTSALSAACGATTWESSCASVLQVGDVVKASLFGANGGDLVDDRAELQTALCCAEIMKKDTGRAVVDFGAGRYQLSGGLQVAPGITLRGDGAVLAASSSFTSGYIIDSVSYADSADSDPLTIQGFTLDASSATGSASLLRVAAASASAGKVRLSLDGLTLRGAPGEGIALGTNVHAKLRNITTVDLQSFALRLYGGNGELQVSNFSSRTGTGTGPNAGALLLSPGAASDAPSVIQLVNTYTEGAFTAGMANDSTLIATNLSAKNGPSKVNATSGIVRIANSTLGSKGGSSANGLRTKDGVFREVAFVANSEAGVTEKVYTPLIDFGAGDNGFKIELVDCSYQVGSSIEPDDTVYGIYSAYDAGSIDATVMVRGGRIESGFDYPVRFLGGKLYMQGTFIDGAGVTGIGLGSAGDRALSVHLDGVRFSDTLKCSESISTYPGNATIKHSNFEVSDALNEYVYGECGFSKASYSGRRVITGSAPPVSSEPCIAGDTYRLSVPAATGEYEWVCSATSNLPAAGTWKLLSKLN
jgi:hypothetical protein